MTLTPAVLAVPKPSLGRIVIVHFDGEDVPAIVTGINDNFTLTIHATLFRPLDEPIPITNICHKVMQAGDTDWRWPDRV